MSTLGEANLLRNRTKAFAVRIIKAFARLPKDETVRVIGRQILRSGTSVAANFISKISVVVEETDETLFWLELHVRLNWPKGVWSSH